MSQDRHTNIPPPETPETISPETTPPVSSKTTDPPDTAPAPPESPEPQETPETPDPLETSASPTPESPLETLQAERDDLFGRLQRVSADFQNTLKRHEHQLADSIAFAKGDLLRSFIPLLDTFEQALTRQPEHEEAKAVYDGFRIIQEEFLKTIQQAGVERITPEAGDAFDPHLHEAMMQQPAEGIAPNHVSAVFGPGYVYKGRTLRPAKVAVAPAP